MIDKYAISFILKGKSLLELGGGPLPVQRHCKVFEPIRRVAVGEEMCH